MPELRSCRKSLRPVVQRKYPKNLLQTKYLNQKQSGDKDLTARLVGVLLVCRFKNTKEREWDASCQAVACEPVASKATCGWLKLAVLAAFTLDKKRQAPSI